MRRALVAVIGGWRPACPRPHLHVFVVDVAGPRAARPCARARLGNAAVPDAPRLRRRRDTAVGARPRWGAGAALARSSSAARATAAGPAPTRRPARSGASLWRGPHTLSLMSFCARDGSVVKWQEGAASGSAPALDVAPPVRGLPRRRARRRLRRRRVDDDPSSSGSTTASAAGHVYVLEVEACAWARGDERRAAVVALAARRPRGARRRRRRRLGGPPRPRRLRRARRAVLRAARAPTSSRTSSTSTRTRWRTAPPAERMTEDGGGGGRARADGGRSRHRSSRGCGCVPPPRVRQHGSRHSGHGDARYLQQSACCAWTCARSAGPARACATRRRRCPTRPPRASSAASSSAASKFTHFGIRPCPALDLLVLRSLEDDGDVGGETAAAAAAGAVERRGRRRRGGAVGGGAAGAGRGGGGGGGGRGGRRRRRRAARWSRTSVVPTARRGHVRLPFDLKLMLGGGGSDDEEDVEVMGAALSQALQAVWR